MLGWVTLGRWPLNVVPLVCSKALMWLGRCWLSRRGVCVDSSGSSLMWLSSSHAHSSQHRPSSLSSRGLGQCQVGRGTCWGQRGMQPTTPSIQVHWCWQLGWKSSPCWYTRPLNSQGKPWASAVNVHGQNRKQRWGETFNSIGRTRWNPWVCTLTQLTCLIKCRIRRGKEICSKRYATDQKFFRFPVIKL